MMTPQDIREKAFEKAVFGGYDMGAVDSFMEEVANDIAALNKENAVLKSKLKVLVEKVEEYRSTEDAMRMALLSAQKMSVEITNEAKSKADALLSSAQAEADAVLNSARSEVVGEEARLVEAKRSSAQFIETMRKICIKQLDFLDAINELPLDLDVAPEPQPESRYIPEQDAPPDEDADDGVIDSTVRSIEDSVARMPDEPELDLRPGFDSDLDGLQPGELEEEPTRQYTFGDFGDDEVTPRPKFNFDDLRFGENLDRT